MLDDPNNQNANIDVNTQYLSIVENEKVKSLADICWSIKKVIKEENKLFVTRQKKDKMINIRYESSVGDGIEQQIPVKLDDPLFVLFGILFKIDQVSDTSWARVLFPEDSSLLAGGDNNSLDEEENDLKTEIQVTDDGRADEDQIPFGQCVKWFQTIREDWKVIKDDRYESFNHILDNPQVFNSQEEREMSQASKSAEMYLDQVGEKIQYLQNLSPSGGSVNYIEILQNMQGIISGLQDFSKSLWEPLEWKEFVKQNNLYLVVNTNDDVNNVFDLQAKWEKCESDIHMSNMSIIHRCKMIEEDLRNSLMSRWIWYGQDSHVRVDCNLQLCANILNDPLLPNHKKEGQMIEYIAQDIRCKNQMYGLMQLVDVAIRMFHHTHLLRVNAKMKNRLEEEYGTELRNFDQVLDEGVLSSMISNNLVSSRFVNHMLLEVVMESITSQEEGVFVSEDMKKYFIAIVNQSGILQSGTVGEEAMRISSDFLIDRLAGNEPSDRDVGSVLQSLEGVTYKSNNAEKYSLGLPIVRVPKHMMADLKSHMDGWWKQRVTINIKLVGERFTLYVNKMLGSFLKFFSASKFQFLLDAQTKVNSNIDQLKDNISNLENILDKRGVLEYIETSHPVISDLRTSRDKEIDRISKSMAWGDETIRLEENVEKVRQSVNSLKRKSKEQPVLTKDMKHLKDTNLRLQNQLIKMSSNHSNPGDVVIKSAGDMEDLSLDLRNLIPSFQNFLSGGSGNGGVLDIHQEDEEDGGSLVIERSDNMVNELDTPSDLVISRQDNLNGEMVWSEMTQEQQVKMVENIMDSYPDNLNSSNQTTESVSNRSGIGRRIVEMSKRWFRPTRDKSAEECAKHIVHLHRIDQYRDLNQIKLDDLVASINAKQNQRGRNKQRQYSLSSITEESSNLSQIQLGDGVYEDHVSSEQLAEASVIIGSDIM